MDVGARQAVQGYFFSALAALMTVLPRVFQPAPGQPVALGGVKLIAAEPEGWQWTAAIGALVAMVIFLATSSRIGAAAGKGFDRKPSRPSAVDRFADWVD
ncbi:MAG: hypothetical protein JNN02_09875 [Tabrizicola sp.]|nr:hypothetical protein [Tabrizicola sp.]